jgi:hypothetical protein
VRDYASNANEQQPTMLYSFIFAILIVIVVDEMVGCFPKRHRIFALSCVFALVFGRVLRWGTEWLIRHYF